MHTENSFVFEVAKTSALHEGVLFRFGIFRDEWGKSLTEVCSDKGVNINFLLHLINSYSDADVLFEKRLEETSTKNIIEYLIVSHVYYVNHKIPAIFNLINKNIEKNEANKWQLLAMKDIFNKYQCHLVEHIHHEENTLFPYVLNLIKLSETNRSAREIFTFLDKYSINHFINQHQEVEEDINDIRAIVIKNSKSSEIKNPYRIIFKEIQLLEKDLEIHARIEDNVLIPRAIELENILKRRLAFKAKLN